MAKENKTHRTLKDLKLKLHNQVWRSLWFLEIRLAVPSLLLCKALYQKLEHCSGPPAPSFVTSLGMCPRVAGHPSHHSPRGPFLASLFYSVHILLVCVVLINISLAHLLVIFVNWLSPFNFSGSVSGFVLFFVSPFSIIFISSFLYWELQISLFLPSVRSTFLSCFSQNLHVFSCWLHPPTDSFPFPSSSSCLSLF